MMDRAAHARVVQLVLNRYLVAAEADNDHPKHFWGTAGAGALFYAEDTKRVCVQKRSSGVNEPNTWGVWGGAIDPGESVTTGLRRELREETGYGGRLTLELVHVFQKNDFKYHNFVAYVPTEFDPKHSWETSDHAWVDLDDLPTPLHFGLKAALSAFKGTLKTNG